MAFSNGSLWNSIPVNSAAQLRPSEVVTASSPLSVCLLSEPAPQSNGKWPSVGDPSTVTLISTLSAAYWLVSHIPNGKIACFSTVKWQKMSQYYQQSALVPTPVQDQGFSNLEKCTVPVNGSGSKRLIHISKVYFLF